MKCIFSIINYTVQVNCGSERLFLNPLFNRDKTGTHWDTLIVDFGKNSLTTTTKKATLADSGVSFIRSLSQVRQPNTVPSLGRCWAGWLWLSGRGYLGLVLEALKVQQNVYVKNCGVEDMDINQAPFGCIMGNVGSKVFGVWSILGTKSQDYLGSAALIVVVVSPLTL